jgi:hypothetical protein
MCLRGPHAGADPFTDQFSLELRYRSEDVQQKLARRVGLVRIDTLRDSDETNSEARQFLNPGDAMNERTPARGDATSRLRNGVSNRARATRGVR